jgi:hypothetical protein
MKKETKTRKAIFAAVWIIMIMIPPIDEERVKVLLVATKGSGIT